MPGERPQRQSESMQRQHKPFMEKLAIAANRLGTLRRRIDITNAQWYQNTKTRLQQFDQRLEQKLRAKDEELKVKLREELNSLLSPSLPKRK